MRKLILHAGRHKTGTTTLQNVLHRNNDLLLQHNYYYPRYGLEGDGHHGIGAAMTRANMRALGGTASTVLGENRRKLQQDIGENDSTLIISSEAFQNCDPAVVKEFFSGFDTEVIIYLREEIGYLISSYAQKIHSTRYSASIEEYSETTFKDNYTKFIDNWERAFGKKLRLRVYGKEDLIRQDIVFDFMAGVLGLDEEQVKNHYTRKNSNPTLTRALLEYKKAINRSEPLPADHVRLLFNTLSTVALRDNSGKITVSQEVVRSMRSKFEMSNKAIAKKYFNRDTLFTPFQQACTSHDLPEITSNDFSGIRAQLVENAPELDASLPQL